MNDTAGTSGYAPTIAILTALPVECHAVRSLLLHQRFVPADQRDSVSYYRGQLPSAEPGRPFDVILALLAQDGGGAAAAACANLQHDWRVRHIVMCGIACGVPDVERPERHVRLGDILVADEGIVAYDSLRVTADGAEIRRSAARPSAVLLAASRRLRVDEEADERPWERPLDLRNRPAMRSYRRPAPETDVVRDDETGQRVDHPDLNRSGHRPGQPKVHYGLIGSGGRLIRSSRERNRLVRLHRIIGLEMEASGVSDGAYLHGVDWFMVRGVSDYGGGDKNDGWHRYAALAAAAYVYALVGLLPPPPGPQPEPTGTTPRRAPLNRAPAGSSEDTAAPAEWPRPDGGTGTNRWPLALPPHDLRSPDATERSWRDEFVAALLDCRTMRDPDGRNRVIDTLPAAIRAIVPRGGDAFHDVSGLVDALRDTPSAFGLVVAALRRVEHDSTAVIRLRALLDPLEEE